MTLLMISVANLGYGREMTGRLMAAEIQDG